MRPPYWWAPVEVKSPLTCTWPLNFAACLPPSANRPNGTIVGVLTGVACGDTGVIRRLRLRRRRQRRERTLPRHRGTLRDRGGWSAGTGPTKPLACAKNGRRLLGPGILFLYRWFDRRSGSGG